MTGSMISETITRVCGHVETVQIDSARFRTRNALDARIASESKRDCRDCYRERVVAADIAAEQSGKRCQMDGTEKQMGWARSIRQKRATELRDWMTRVEEKGGVLVASGQITDESRVETLTLIRDAIIRAMKGDFPESETARFWIDSRVETPIDFASIIFPERPVNGEVESKQHRSLPADESSVFFAWPTASLIAARAVPDKHMDLDQLDDTPF